MHHVEADWRKKFVVAEQTPAEERRRLEADLAMAIQSKCFYFVRSNRAVNNRILFRKNIIHRR